MRKSAASGGGPRGGAPPAHPPDWRGLTPETALTVGDATQDERESLRDDARSLLTDLRPSVRSDGALATIAAPPQVDLDAPVINLDLHPEEGSRGRTATSLLVQMLFTAVADRATGTDARVVVIDEVHSLLDDAAALAFLETAVRPSRHYDRFVQFVTQTGGSSITSCVMGPTSSAIPGSSAVIVLNLRCRGRPGGDAPYRLDLERAALVTPPGKCREAGRDPIECIDGSGW